MRCVHGVPLGFWAGVARLLLCFDLLGLIALCSGALVFGFGFWVCAKVVISGPLHLSFDTVFWLVDLVVLGLVVGVS